MLHTDETHRAELSASREPAGRRLWALLALSCALLLASVGCGSVGYSGRDIQLSRDVADFIVDELISSRLLEELQACQDRHMAGLAELRRRTKRGTAGLSVRDAELSTLRSRKTVAGYHPPELTLTGGHSEGTYGCTKGGGSFSIAWNEDHAPKLGDLRQIPKEFREGIWLERSAEPEFARHYEGSEYPPTIRWGWVKCIRSAGWSPNEENQSEKAAGAHLGAETAHLRIQSSSGLVSLDAVLERLRERVPVVATTDVQIQFSLRPAEGTFGGAEHRIVRVLFPEPGAMLELTAENIDRAFFGDDSSDFSAVFYQPGPVDRVSRETPAERWAAFLDLPEYEEFTDRRIAEAREFEDESQRSITQRIDEYEESVRDINRRWKKQWAGKIRYYDKKTGKMVTKPAKSYVSEGLGSALADYKKQVDAMKPKPATGSGSGSGLTLTGENTDSAAGAGGKKGKGSCRTCGASFPSHAKQKQDQLWHKRNCRYYGPGALEGKMRKKGMKWDAASKEFVPIKKQGPTKEK